MHVALVRVPTDEGALIEGQGAITALACDALYYLAHDPNYTSSGVQRNLRG